jgi:D-aminoacyl-tRNA deacylase
MSSSAMISRRLVTDGCMSWGMGRELAHDAVECAFVAAPPASVAPPARCARRRDVRRSRSRSEYRRPTMRAVCQRVLEARVRVGGAVVGEVGAGLCILLGVAAADDEAEAVRLAGKAARLRVFPDAEGRFDRSVLDTGGAALVVSQFTLIADTAKGNRPSFSAAAPPERAELLYERFCSELAALGVAVSRGVFGAKMAVELVNDGPVTIVLE